MTWLEKGTLALPSVVVVHHVPARLFVDPILRMENG